uniref:Uncharacterized protein n=1 Tax=viral metagenome TaxID=1070528 RepID=A0A6M3JJ40_9ZZZZ
MKDDIDYSKLPEHIREGVKRYIENGVPPGRFLMAVISNKLLEAFYQADEINEERMSDIVFWFYYEAPGNCRGSEDIMWTWIRSFKKEPEA